MHLCNLYAHQITIPLKGWPHIKKKCMLKWPRVLCLPSCFGCCLGFVMGWALWDACAVDLGFAQDWVLHKRGVLAVLQLPSAQGYLMILKRFNLICFSLPSLVPPPLSGPKTTPVWLPVLHYPTMWKQWKQWATSCILSIPPYACINFHDFQQSGKTLGLFGSAIIYFYTRPTGLYRLLVKHPYKSSNY